MQKSASKPPFIGDLLRERRISVLNKGLREMAAIIGVAPAHLTDLETGRRAPSEDVLQRLSKHYGIPEATLRVGWTKPTQEAKQRVSQNETTLDKGPTLLAAARDLSPAQWDTLIDQARRLSDGKRGSK